MEKKASKRILIAINVRRRKVRSSFWFSYLKYCGYYIFAEKYIKYIETTTILSRAIDDPGLKILFPKGSERGHAVHSYLFLLIAKGLVKTRYNGRLCVISRIR